MSSELMVLTITGDISKPVSEITDARLDIERIIAVVSSYGYQVNVPLLKEATAQTALQLYPGIQAVPLGKFLAGEEIRHVYLPGEPVSLEGDSFLHEVKHNMSNSAKLITVSVCVDVTLTTDANQAMAANNLANVVRNEMDNGTLSFWDYPEEFGATLATIQRYSIQQMSGMNPQCISSVEDIFAETDREAYWEAPDQIALMAAFINQYGDLIRFREVANAKAAEYGKRNV